MDLFSFSSLSVEDRPAIEDYIMKATREATEEERTAAREHATATTEEEEGTKESA